MDKRRAFDDSTALMEFRGMKLADFRSAGEYVNAVLRLSTRLMKNSCGLPPYLIWLTIVEEITSAYPEVREKWLSVLQDNGMNAENYSEKMLREDAGHLLKSLPYGRGRIRVLTGWDRVQPGEPVPPLQARTFQWVIDHRVDYPWETEDEEDCSWDYDYGESS